MAETIVTNEKASSTSSPLEPASRIICHVCQKQFSQYTCPRCNSRYCSLLCYKSHSTRCTESFMRENVVEEMAQLQSDDETKQKMLDILKRFHSEEETEDSLDEDDSTLSEETIQKILSGGQIHFEDLSPDEKKHFLRAVASGELSKMIGPWDPWWLKPSAKAFSLSKEGTQLVQPLIKHEIPVSHVNDPENSQPSKIPPGPESPLPSVAKLSSTEPSPLLTVHLVDILYSYCFTLRLYNGDWQSDAIGSAMVVLSVSSVLGQFKQPETVWEALFHSSNQTCSPAFRHMGGRQFAYSLLDDVISILTLGRSSLICALCDLQRLIQAGERALKSEKPKELNRADIKSKLKSANRKICFIMCWVNEQPGEAWSSLAAIVRAEKCSAMEFEGDKSSVKMNDGAKNRGKVLVEEVQ